jgi:hypothetical protein
VTKKLGFKALTLTIGLGLSVVLVSGCNPEEPAKTSAPPTSPPAVNKAPADAKGAPAAPKEAGKM